MPSIYIHVPFCLSKCPYCDFASGFWPGPGALDRYAEALTAEMAALKNRAEEVPLAGGEFTTLYIGGGTPSLMERRHLERILDGLQKNFNCAFHEFTLEVNPDDVTPEKAREWKAAGVSRVSLGFQSMEDGILRFLGRRGAAERNRRSFGLLREAGFENISVDVIHSIAGENLEYTLAEIIKLKPEHVSAYNLTLTEGTPLHAGWKSGKYKPHDDETAAADLRLVRSALSGAGYRRYEISNYAAAPERESAHNKNYWDMGEYLGLGAAAAGFYRLPGGAFKGVRYVNAGDPEGYAAFLRAGGLPVKDSETIGGLTAVREFIMLQLRKTDGLSFGLFKELFGRDWDECLPAGRLTGGTVRGLDGLLEASGGGIRLTERGMEVMNSVVVGLWEMMN